ncbi:hypothetical protein J2X77_003817 [Sphingobacterium sp. 2149]|nr:hypothetical protein [Sphingobacterium sp. 2149]
MPSFQGNGVRLVGIVGNLFIPVNLAFLVFI